MGYLSFTCTYLFRLPADIRIRTRSQQRVRRRSVLRSYDIECSGAVDITLAFVEAACVKFSTVVGVHCRLTVLNPDTKQILTISLMLKCCIDLAAAIRPLDEEHHFLTIITTIKCTGNIVSYSNIMFW